MTCPNCKTPTLIALSPVSWFCSRCGKFHTDFRMDGIFDDELKAPAITADAEDRRSVVDTAVTVPQDKQSTASVKQKGANAKRM